MFFTPEINFVTLENSFCSHHHASEQTIVHIRLASEKAIFATLKYSRSRFWSCNDFLKPDFHYTNLFHKFSLISSHHLYFHIIFHNVFQFVCNPSFHFVFSECFHLFHNRAWTAIPFLPHTTPSGSFLTPLQ